VRVAVLASGEGTNLQALVDELHAPGGAAEPGSARHARGGAVELVAVASDKRDAPALGRAQAAGIATETFPRERFADRCARDTAITAWLQAHGAELVVLAGYMALLDAAFVRHWAGRLVNVHPSLLPAFPGMGAIEQALDYGVALFGVTVHLVDEGIDTGPILLQEAVALPEARTPEEVHGALRPLEHRLLCAAVRAFAAGEVRPDPAHPRRWLVG
jgi:phosphoribosylglycinamide formyltransferase-1